MHKIKVLDTQLKNTKLYLLLMELYQRDGFFRVMLFSQVSQFFTITMSKNLWIVAYLEETNIAEIHTGQNVRFTIDAFSDVTFNGKVFLVGSSTASVFSLIPANNASGNFTKVTQRIPVRISIDRAERGKRISSLNILSGMSAIARLLKDRMGKGEHYLTG